MLRRIHANVSPPQLLRTSMQFPTYRQARLNSTPSYQPPNPPQKAATPNSSEESDPRGSAAKPHRAFYSNFGKPLFKTFLMALFTYQVLYWGWLKLESIEMKRDKDAEVKSLEDEVKGLLKSKTEKS
ncbi:hypothetical protein NA57DRAFT_75912 [Rhizodiscina lignyota]|uniref:Inner membrane assembly complex subunit 17 n=1 Tax=Rhizodiscina lignyota TaxID=1504668 RepID=A0A9P4IBS9_9PEZI|nr:hypothetical protein NA57DRAFT_75912 [Rhizodiscina lignyota]